MKIKTQSNHYADNLTTPIEIFRKCQKIWNTECTLDVCATKNTTKCNDYFSIKDNGLKQEWKSKCIWCNPPHSQTGLWVKKAYEQWIKHNIRIIMLLPVNTLTSNYFKKYAMPYIKFQKKMILSRINFLNPRTNKPSKYNSVNGYMTIFYERRKHYDKDKSQKEITEF